MTVDRLLLIEDDPDAARLIDRALGEAGFAVHRTPTGEEGLDYLVAHSVAGVILDYRLPFANGLEILRLIRERLVGIPIVMISSAGSIEVAVKAIKADAFDFVEKHHNYLPSLVARVRDAVADARTRTIRGRVARPVFIGREAERSLLREEFARVAAGTGRLVLLVGDDGIGKTSLALQADQMAREQGALVLWGHCHETGGAPAYWPWIRVLRAYAEAVDAATLREDLGASAAIVRELAPGLAVPGVETGFEVRDPEVARFQLVDGVTQIVKRAAARRPLVLVLDDLHRADGGSLHLLKFLATELADAPVLVVGAYRGGGTAAELGELARVADQPTTTVVHMGGFDEDGVRRYIDAATAVRPSDAVVRAVYRKTEGHPLFVTEVVRLLAADGRLGETADADELRVAIPESRRQVIANRLARLSASCRKLLEVAAVIGREFATDLLARAAPTTPEAVQAAIEEAVDAAVLVGTDEPGVFRFSHVLVRDVLYEALLPGRRGALHARVAEAMEALSVAGDELPLAAIAHHFLQAADEEGDLRRAIDYAIAAGDRAAGVMAHEEAARQYELALRAAERVYASAPAFLRELASKLAEAHWRAGDLGEARAFGRRALVLAREAGDPAAIATAALTFAGRLPGFGAIVSDEEVVRELEQALAGLPLSATALRAQVMARLAEELTYSTRRTADRSLGPKAIELAHSLDDPAVLASVLRTTQWAVWTPDDVERRRQLADEVVGLARRTRDRVLALDGELLRLWSALERGETEHAQRQLALASRLAAELRLPYYAWITAAARACIHIATARLDEAERVADEAFRAGEALGNPTVRLFVGVQRGHILWLRGRFDELAHWLGEVLPNFPLLASTVECSLIVTYAAAGQRERALAELARFAADDFAGVPRNAMWLMNMNSLAEASAALGDAGVAAQLRPHLEPFLPYNVIFPPAFVLAPVSHYVARLDAVLGDTAAARRHFEDALVLEGRTGTRHWIAHTQAALARLLLASGDPADASRAAQLLGSARAIATELGLRSVLEAAATVALADAPLPSRGRCAFRRLGVVWELEYLGRRVSVPHRVGMEHLRRLLERPGTTIAATELARLGEQGALVESDGDGVVDKRAVADVRRRVADLETEVEECERSGDVGRVDALREEIDRLESYLRDQGRSLMSAAEKARSAVTKAIDRAVREITAVHEPLGCHLELHVRTGRLCVYIPDPGSPLTFDV